MIGNNTAETKDLIENGVTSLLSEDRDTDDPVRQLERAMEYKEKAGEIVAKGRKFIVGNRTVELNARKTNALYPDVIGGGAPAEVIAFAVYAMAFHEGRGCA